MMIRGVPYRRSAHATTVANARMYRLSPSPLSATHSALSSSARNGARCRLARLLLASVVSRSTSDGGADTCTSVDAVNTAM
nr:hypothetical protein [Actinomadura sp. J1-007]